MATSRIQQLEELFQQAADLPAEQRGTLLDQRCGTDTSLRVEVEQLLQAHEVQLPRLPRFLDGTAHVVAPEAGQRPTCDRPPDVGEPSHSGAPSLLQPGQQFGKYLVEKKLGEGGQAVVYQAFDRLGVAGHVALKLPRAAVPADRIEAWVRDEVEPLVKLDHPSIVKVVDGGCVDGVPYVATELVDAMTLDAWVKVQRPTPRRIVAWLAQLTGAVQAAHQRGVIHRDLKPRNILIDRRGQARIIDFAISTLLSPYAPAPDSSGISGTLAYMAPEQARAEASADHRVDIFALGAVLKFLLDGKPPYEATTSAAMLLQAAQQGRVVFVDEKSGSRVRRRLTQIANRALQPQRDQRYPTADAMAHALRPLCRPRRRIVLLVCILSVPALLAAFLFGWWGPDWPALAQRAPRSVPSAVSDVRECPAKPRLESHAREVEFGVHFQRRDQHGSYQRLTPDVLPLCTGDRLQVHVRLSEPMYAVVAAITAGGQIVILSPEETHLPPRVITEVHIPPKKDHWLPLEPPEGTETLVLLASTTPPGDLAGLQRELAALGATPTLDEQTLLIADEHGARLLMPGGTTRDLGKRPVQSEKGFGFVEKLLQGATGKWDCVRILAFPHHPPPAAPR